MTSRTSKNNSISTLFRDANAFQECKDTFCIDAKFGGRKELANEHPNDIVLRGKGSVTRAVLKAREEPKITIEMNIIEILASDAFRAKVTTADKVQYLKDTFFDPLQLRVIPKTDQRNEIIELLHVAIDYNTPWQEYMRNNNHRYFILDCSDWSIRALGNTALYEPNKIPEKTLTLPLDSDRIEMSLINDGTPLCLYPAEFEALEADANGDYGTTLGFEIATRFAYANGSQYWLSDMTWAEMFYDSLTKSNPGFVEKYNVKLVTDHHRYDLVDPVFVAPHGYHKATKRTFITADWSRDHSHNFILRHNSIHPYLQDASNVWYLESRRLSNAAIEKPYEDECNMTIKVDGPFAQRLINRYYGVSESPMGIPSLKSFLDIHREAGDSKYQRFIGILKDEERGENGYPEWMSESYDGMIVTIYDERGSGRTYVVASAKLKVVEQLVYQRVSSETLLRTDPLLRGEYNALRCILRHDDARKVLFPQWDMYDERYQPYFNKIVHMLLHRCALDKAKKPFVPSSDPLRKFVDSIYSSMMYYLRSERNIAVLDPDDVNARKAMMELIINPNHALTLLIGYHTFSGKYVKAAEPRQSAE